MAVLITHKALNIKYYKHGFNFVLHKYICNLPQNIRHSDRISVEPYYVWMLFSLPFRGCRISYNYPVNGEVTQSTQVHSRKQFVIWTDFN